MIKFILIYGLILGYVVMEGRITTNCNNKLCGTCWERHSSNCTTCKNHTYYVVKVNAFQDYLEVGGICTKDYSPSASTIRFLFKETEANVVMED